MKRIWSIFSANVRATVRDPYLIFFDIVFPISIYIFFVQVFVPAARSLVIDVYVYVPENVTIVDKALKNISEEGMRIHKVPVSTDDLVAYVREDALSKKRIPRLIVFPRDFEERLRSNEKVNVDVYISRDDPLSFSLDMVIREVLRVSDKLADSPISTATHYLEATGQSSVNRVTLNGLFVFWLIVGGMHCVSQYVYLLESRMNKRLLVTPLRKHEFVLELALEAALVAIGISIIVSLIAVIGYQASFLNNPFNIALLLIGALTVVIFAASLGLLVASFAKEPSQAIWGPLAVFMALMFFSGFAIPAQFFPKSLQTFANYLPTRSLALAIESSIIYQVTSFRSFIYPALSSLTMLAIAILVMPWRDVRR